MNNFDLYIITDRELTRKTILDDVKQALASGVRIIQYREKEKSTKDMVNEANKIKKLCEGKATFLINDRIDVALASDADGVHLGQDDMPYEVARKILGNKIIGLTVHNVKEAINAEKIGADYLGVSPIFQTTTKLDAGKPAGLNLIEEIKKVTNIPLVGIGGINLDNVLSVIKAGAQGAAVISAILTKEDIQLECDKFRGIINDTT